MSKGKKRHQFFGLRYPATGLPVYLDELGSQLAIKAVVYSGNGIDIAVPLPGEELDGEWQDAAPIRAWAVKEANAEDWIGILQATDDPHAFELDASGAVKAVHRKTQRALGTVVQWQVYRRDGFKCLYCGREGGDTGTTLTVDHFVPIEHGGTDELGNLATSCKRCNKDKGSRPAREYLGDEKFKRIRDYLDTWPLRDVS